MAAKEAFQVLSDAQSRSTYDRQLVSMCASAYTLGAAQGLTNTECTHLVMHVKALALPHVHIPYRGLFHAVWRLRRL